MENMQVGDILIIRGRSYISIEKYKDLQNQLHAVQETAEIFLQKLTAIEIANENRKSMRIIRTNLV